MTPVSDWLASLVEPKSNPPKLKFVVVFATVCPSNWVVFVFSSEGLASIEGVYIDCTPFTLVVVLYSPNWAPSFPEALEACKISTFVSK